MIRNYLKIAIRNIRKHSGYSFLNVAGLSLGLTCSIIIFLYVADEFGYDKAHVKSENIYRAVCTYYLPKGAGVEHNAVMGPPVGPLLVEDYPEVVQSVRFQSRSDRMIEDEKGNRYFETVYMADSNVFDLFTFPLVKGDPATALDQPYKMVLSKEMAMKYFNTLEVVGKQLKLPEDSVLFSITGVLDDIPSNSHLQFDFLASFETLESMGVYMQSWWSFSTWTYLELVAGANQSLVEDKIKLISRKYIADQEDGSGYKQEYALQKFTDIHLNSDLRREMEPNSKKAYIYVFLLVGILILVIACINFMNLATARSALRAKEIGVRKVSGAYREQLIGQFLGEALVLTIISVVLAIIFVSLALPSVNDFMEKSLSFNFIENPIYLAQLIGLILIVTILAGAYPAISLSGFKPTETLKGNFNTSGKGNLLRKVLVVFQFTISVFLIGGTLVIYDQLSFMRQKDLGFSKERVIYIPTRYTNNATIEFRSLKKSLESFSDVVAVSLSGTVPGLPMNNNVVRMGWEEDSEWSDMRYIDADEDFVSTYGLEFVSGRNFDKDRPSDADNSFILNESGIRRLGFTSAEEALNKPLRWQNRNGRVIGVLKDFHFMGVNQNIEPFIMVASGDRTPGYLSVKISSDDLPASLATIRNQFFQIMPGNEFEYSFLNDEFDQQYKAEDRFMSLFTIFSGLAIIIACFGLYGLAAFIAQLKTKEIGIRKVLGANSSGLVVLLNRDFTKLILIAIIIAIPAGYLGAQEWVSSFPYQIEPGIFKFLLAGVGSILIAWLTVGYQSIKAAKANPVDSIGNE